MSITVKFTCDGCHKAEQGKTFLRRSFDSFSGRGYGFGVWRKDTVEDVCPEGWHAFDPITGCCYCPECWASIEAGEDETQPREAAE